jgi:C4-dicarboxylate transporter DctM subunit
MSPTTAAIIGFSGFIILLIIGLPVSLSAAFMGFIGLVLTNGLEGAFFYLGTAPYSEISIYSFTVLPLFIIMGDFFEGGGYVKMLFTAAKNWVGNFRGGLAIGTIIGGAAFAAACGSSVAASAILGKVCVPEMQKQGYQTAFSAATAATSACLATMIPPSTLMVIYGIVTQASIGKLLIAGIIPGIVMTIVYILTVSVLIRRNPLLAPAVKLQITWGERFGSLKGLWSLIIMILVIMGGLYFGILTPTEAGAAGAFCALIMGLASRQLGRKGIWDGLLDAGKTTSFVLFIVVGVMLLTRFLTQANVPSALAEFLTSLPVPRVGILILICIAYLLLGCFIDAPSMLILTLPVFFPTVIALGYDPTFFGILVVLLAEIGLLTPPVGMNVFVMKGVVPGTTLADLFKAETPYVIASIFCVALFIAFPQIVLFLPNNMMGN